MPQRHPAPHQQLLGLAQRARAKGLTFEDFWLAAIPEPAVWCRNPKCGGPVVRGKKCRRCGRVPMIRRPLPTDSELYVHIDDKGRERLLPSKPLPRIGSDAPEGSILWPRDSVIRGDAYDATWYARYGWRRAYEDEPVAPTERALVRMAPFLEGALLAAR